GKWARREERRSAVVCSWAQHTKLISSVAVTTIDVTKMKAGDRHTYERVFSADEVKAFAELSGDIGVHHFTPDEQGRLMLHGLLTASLPTKLGGAMNFQAREMHFEFIKPAYSGERLSCLGVVESVILQRSRLKVAFS